MGKSMVRFPFLPAKARCRFSLFAAGLALAWPVPAPHGHSVFSTVSPHARPCPDCPTDFVWFLDSKKSSDAHSDTANPHVVHGPFSSLFGNALLSGQLRLQPAHILTAHRSNVTLRMDSGRQEGRRERRLYV